MHTKKRIELIIEKMAYQRAGRIMVAAGITGYTVVPALAGYGDGSHWQRDQDISASRDMVMMVAIADEARATKSLEDLSRLLGNHIGIVNVTTVEVLRPDRF